MSFYRRGTKYHASKVQSEDGTFDSRKEYNEWLKLKELEKKGKIKDLQRQVVFELVKANELPHPIKKNGRMKRKEKPVTYKADFTFIDVESMQLIVMDVKGFETTEYIIKRKLMLDKYGIQIVEV